MSRYLTTLTRSLFLAAGVALSSCGGSGGGSPQPNRPPEIGDLPSVQINENELYILDIPVSDPDGDTVSLNNISRTSGISFNGNQLRWIPRDDQVGTYLATIRASDGRGGYAEKSFDIEVIDDFSDDPVVSSIPDAEKTEGKDFSYQVVAKDPDTGQTDTLKYKLGSQTTFNGLSVNSKTGLLEWNNLPLGKYKIEVEVEDVTSRKDSKSFELTVVEPRYVLSGKVVDIDGNPMPNVSVSLKGKSTGAAVTNQNGEYEIKGLLRGNYDAEIYDLLNTVYDRGRGFFKFDILGDLSQDLLNIRMRQVESNDIDYLDGTGTRDFLAMLKDVTDTKEDPPGMPKVPKNLRRRNTPVPVYLNKDNHLESAESMLPSLDADGNGQHDFFDRAEEAMALLESLTGIDLFETSPIPVGWDDLTFTQHSPGIFFRYPVLPSGGGDSSSANPTGPYSEIEIRYDADPARFRQMVFRELMTVLGMKHTKGDHYILIDEQGPYGTLNKTVTEPHEDEIEVLKTIYKLPNGTDMRQFEGR